MRSLSKIGWKKVCNPGDCWLGVLCLHIIKALSNYIVDGQLTDGRSNGQGNADYMKNVSMAFDGQGAIFAERQPDNQMCEAYCAIAAAVERLTEAQPSFKLLSKLSREPC